MLLKLKYRLGTRRTRGSKNASNNSGTPRAKGLDHPIRVSGRTLGRLQGKFRPPTKQKKV